MPAWRWTVYDPVTAVTWTFPINPHAGGTPSRRKRIDSQNTSAPGGKTLLFEGQDEVQEISCDGTILDQALHDALVAWWEKRYQVQLTDDLGRVMWVYLKTFEPKRARNAERPWKHQYTITAVILDWP